MPLWFALIIVLMPLPSYLEQNAHGMFAQILLLWKFSVQTVFVIQWLWRKDQKTLSDQDSLWQSFLSRTGRLVRVFSASQSRNLDDFYFLLQICDGARPLHNAPVSMCAALHGVCVCYFCACMCAHTACVSRYICLCVCVFPCVYGGSVSSSVCFQCFRDLPGSPLLCCWVPPLQPH